jgi:formylglycine-generating enzyme required for sulfatase activity
MIAPAHISKTSRDQVAHWRPAQAWALFVFVIMLYVGLGVSLIRPMRRMRAEVDIERAGATVHSYRDMGYVSRYIQGPTSVEFANRMTDADLRFIRAMPGLSALDLSDSQVTNAGLAQLNEMTGLSELNLSRTRVGDEGIAHLRSMQGMSRLYSLDLSGTSVGDAGLAYLVEMTDMHFLDLSGTHLTDTGLVHLKSLARLESLKVARTDVTDAGLAHLIGLRHLNTLDLSGTQVTDAGLIHLRRFPVLSTLDLSVTAVTDAGCDRLKQYLPQYGTVHRNSHLGSVYLGSFGRSGQQMTDAGMAAVCNQVDSWQGSGTLDLQGTDITDAGLVNLRWLTAEGAARIEELILRETQVGDAGLSHLTGLVNMRLLDLGETRVTEVGCRRLEQALPGCHIVCSGLTIGRKSLLNEPPSIPYAPRLTTDAYPWPADAPPPAVAPFDADQAKMHQKAWGKHLGVPVEYENSIGMKFVLIPPGEFIRGTTAAEIEETLLVVGETEHWKGLLKREAPHHKAILTRPMYLGLHEVTQAQFEQIMGHNPSHFAASGPGKDVIVPFGVDTSIHPVEMVSWNEAAEFCAKLSEKEQLRPFYSRKGEAVTLLKGTGYRLPTEAEWEFACRAGTTTKYWIGDRDEELSQAGWHLLNSWERTHPIGELEPNPFGLYDILGNVSEWAHDEWEPSCYMQFQKRPALDPCVESSVTSQKVVRGGSWYSMAFYCRAASRFGLRASLRGKVGGFRVALMLEAVHTAL